MLKEKINIIVVDDHPIIRNGLCDILIKFPFINEVDQAESGEKLFELMKKKVVDLVILDIRMPDMDGVDVAKIIKSKYSETAVMMFTSHMSEHYIYQCYDIGVESYLSKDSNTDEIKTAIQTVMKGEHYFSSNVKTILLKKLTQKEKGNKDKFTDREKEILKYICEGKVNKKIAEILFISENTVNNHRANIMKKANCHNTRELYEYALLHKLIEIHIN